MSLQLLVVLVFLLSLIWDLVTLSGIANNIRLQHWSEPLDLLGIAAVINFSLCLSPLFSHAVFFGACHWHWGDEVHKQVRVLLHLLVTLWFCQTETTFTWYFFPPPLHWLFFSVQMLHVVTSHPLLVSHPLGVHYDSLWMQQYWSLAVQAVHSIEQDQFGLFSWVHLNKYLMARITSSQASSRCPGHPCTME